MATNIDNLTTEYVKKIISSVDPDLGLQIVISGVSLNPNHLLKMIITCADVSYYRNMIRDMNKTNTNETYDLSTDDIAQLLETDGWII